MINSYKDLLVWQKSMNLVELCYKVTGQLPKNEKYTISSQINRAAISIPSNIAEGYKRNGRAEYVQFCGIASGSAAELETQLIIVSRVYCRTDYVTESLNSVAEVQKMLYALIKRLQAKPKPLNP